jgi:hypothetical protein
MFTTNNDLGAALYKTWTEKQRCDEIEKLVTGFRNGVPIGVLCAMSEAIAGDKKKAKKYLKQFLTATERKTALAAATGGMVPLLKSFLS